MNDKPDTTTNAPFMSPASFARWLDDIKGAGIASSDAAAGRALGITPRAILDLKAKGADKRTALACAAILARVPPYPEL